MRTIPRTARTIALLAASCVLAASTALAQEVRVMTSGGFTAAYLDVVPEFERATKHKVLTAFGASHGRRAGLHPEPARARRTGGRRDSRAPALDDLIKQGKVVPGSRVDLVRSVIGMAVRTGAPKPDISTVEALKRTLLQAKSIAYSASASGVYLSTELFQRLGIADQMKQKAKRIESERVGTVVARGDAEIGFQQVSELLPIAGIDYVGPLPDAVQRITVFSAGIATGAREPEAAKALIRFLASPAARPAIAKSGLEPAGVD